VALAANRGPSAAQKRAKAEALAQAQKAAEEAAIHQSQAALLSSISITPASGTANVALDSAVTVSTTSGSLSSVKVVSTAGAPLAGALSSSGKWVATGELLPSTTYTVTVSATGQGVSVSRTSSFSTLTPTETVSASVYPTTGMTIGVGQPIVVTFDHDVTSTAVQKAIDARLTVAMSKPVAGGWYWFNDHELHFRPVTFWPAHETVQITGNLSGIDVGSGEWTAGSVLDSFAVGDARISYANLETERMTVTLNGVTVYSYPISGGRPQYPTMNGIHIVMDRESVVHMVSSTVGIPVNSANGYDEYVYDDVHISDSGEYVHAAPWSVSSQGVTNVSHGCINLSPANAEQFFGFSRVGDLVEVVGSPRPPAWGDHGVMDWSGPVWSQWTPAQVVALASAAPAPTTTVVPTTSGPATAGASVTTLPAVTTTTRS
jgi:lipoprotein-anchoring transpeptidase ErfK/SrfK